MFPSRRKPSKKNPSRVDEPLLAASLRPENYLAGLVVGFLLGLFVDFARGTLRNRERKASAAPARLKHAFSDGAGSNGGEELKMVLVVRQDLKMGAGKIASQCAHAATGMYAELLQRSSVQLNLCGFILLLLAKIFITNPKLHRSLLRQWEQCGQPKIVVTCKNQQEMNILKDTADKYDLPTFIVADAGRTQVRAGSKTVLAIGPGRKAVVDSVTGKQRLL